MLDEEEHAGPITLTLPTSNGILLRFRAATAVVCEGTDAFARRSV
jgi:hypothetical protein